jgi:hypothetical protein
LKNGVVESVSQSSVELAVALVRGAADKVEVPY